MRFSHLILPACAAALLALASACSGSKEKSADTEAAEATEAAAPAAATAVIDLAEGASIDFTSGKPVVIDFNATWCGPCKKFAPIFEEVAAKYADKVLFYSVDVDKHPKLAAEYNVQSIPMVAYISADGSQTSTQMGLQPADEFEASVAALLK